MSESLHGVIITFEKYVNQLLQCLTKISMLTKVNAFHEGTHPQCTIYCNVLISFAFNDSVLRVITVCDE